MKHSDLSNKIIGAAIEVHTKLGPRLFEHVYKECLAYRLNKMGIKAVKEYPIPLTYEDVKLKCGYRADILVENEIIIEIKSIERLAPIHFLQIMTNLKLGHFKLGLLINFNEVLLKSVLKRIVNGY